MSASEPCNSQNVEPRASCEPPDEPQTSFEIPKKLKYIEPQARIVLANVLHFFEAEAKAQRFLVHPYQTQERTTAATGVKKRCLHLVKQQERLNPYGDKFTKGVKRIHKERQGVSSPEMHDVGKLRGFLFDLILTGEKIPSYTVLEAFQNVGLYDRKWSRTSLPRLLKNLGFTFKRTRNKWGAAADGPPQHRSTLIENHHVQFARFTFLRDLLKFKNEGRTIVYVSVVMFPFLKYVVAPIPGKISWGDKDWKGVIGLAGDEQRMLDDGFSFWRCSRELGNFYFDYSACSEDYVAWVVDRVLPSCPEQVVIVLDHNPKYFDKIADPPPPQLSSKDDMKSWLSRNGIPHDENAAKVELYELIRKTGKTLDKSFVKSAIEQKGFTVLQLPMYHWELHPATSISREIRNMVVDQKVYKFNDVAEFVESQVIARRDRWKDYVSKCWALSEKYFALHPALEERQDTFAKMGLIDPDEYNDDGSESEGDWLPEGDDKGGQSDEELHEVEEKPSKAKKVPQQAFLVGDDVDPMISK